MTCNFSLPSVNLFNTAVTTPGSLFFTSECTKTFWWPGALPRPAGGDHSAPQNPRLALRGGAPRKGKERREGKEREREGTERKRRRKGG